MSSVIDITNRYAELQTTKAYASNKETEERIQDLVTHFEEEKTLLEKKYENIFKVKRLIYGIHK